MAEFLTGFSNILWGAPVLILLGIVGLLYEVLPNPENGVYSQEYRR